MPTPPVHDPTDAGSRLAGAARLGALTAGVIALALGALGCGGGGGSTSAQAVTMTKAEFVAKANAICAKDDPQLSEASAKLAALHTPAEVTAGVRSSFVPAIEGQVQEIRALGSPTGEQAATATMLRLVQGDLARLKADPGLVSTDIFHDFAQVAHAYGLTSCAPLS
ncbi:MAG TPA: hypothetical protein VKG62_05820 [Solirubrobacteraceae bacterium]|nr:hypothetical protein [Solirubrobacteraceae bacterium]